MTVDLQRILASKRAYRKRLASLSMCEKLRMLDALRERELAIRGTAIRFNEKASVVSEAAYSSSRVKSE